MVRSPPSSPTAVAPDLVSPGYVDGRSLCCSLMASPSLWEAPEAAQLASLYLGPYPKQATLGSLARSNNWLPLARRREELSASESPVSPLWCRGNHKGIAGSALSLLCLRTLQPSSCSPGEPWDSSATETLLLRSKPFGLPAFPFMTNVLLG